ncbi:MAG: hypothetical protein JW937_06780, partial [Candidatus Omnitrophica bacterium]|nr:hypothetical protein [Candidatus Omnitrophota bacterium]
MPDTVRVPEEYGRVVESYRAPEGGSSKHILHIQDIHAHTEAQTNSAHLIEHLQQEYGVDLVAVEGAFGDFDLRFFRAFPDDAKTREQVAGYFFEKGLLTGADYLAITSENPPTLYGIDDEQLYFEQLAVFKKRYSNQSDLEDLLEPVELSIAQLQKEIYSPRLQQFIDRAEAFESADADLREYAQHLERLAKEHSLPIQESSDFSALLRLGELEGQFDPDGVKAKLQKLADSESLQDPRILEDPEIRTYLEYVKLSQALDTHDLLSQLKQLEDQLGLALCGSSEEKDFLLASRYLGKMTKLADFKLNREELSKYQSGEGRNELQSLVPKAMWPELGKELQSLEKFYTIAFDRDQAMVENVLQAMEREGVDTAVLIGGGFHTEGMMKALAARNISYTVIAPRSTTPQDEEKYHGL